MDFGTFEDELAIKSYIISLLVKQATADGEFSYMEKEYLDYASEALKLDHSDVLSIVKAPDSFAISPPPDEDKRVTILYYLLFMMRADQVIDPKEEELCHKLGFQLGFRPDMVRQLVDVMKQYLMDDIPPQAMLDKIRPFLN